MLKHYIKASLRNISRHRLFSVINLLGLTIGLASFLIIFLYVQDELRYDAFHKDSERVYRIIKDYKEGNGGGANLPGILEEHLQEKVPQVESLASFYRDRNPVVRHENQLFAEPSIHYTSPEMFRILSLELITGNPGEALAGPYKMVITPQMAKKYFGQANPIGQTLRVDQNQQYEITGILKPFPEQSHLQVNFLASLSSIKQQNKMAYTHWGFQASYFYLKLKEGANPRAAEKIINRLYFDQRGERSAEAFNLDLQPLSQIYLHSSDLEYDMARHSNARVVYGFSVLAVFILIIGGFNYMNLSTARMSIRAKETGMRKVVGASRGKILWQFLGESFVFTVMAAAGAILVTQLALPWFNQLAGKSLGTGIWKNPGFIAAIAGIILLMGLFAGSYPALLLSKTRPLSVMKGSMGPWTGPGKKGKNNARGTLKFRQLLVLLQFAISVFLIIAAIVVHQQIHFIQNKNLGVKQEQVAIIKNPYNKQMGSRFEAFTSQINNYPEVRRLSSTFSAPPHPINNFTRLKSLGSSGKGKQLGLISVNYGYFETVGATVFKGHGFTKDFKGEAKQGVVLNETAARHLGLDNPMGKTLTGFYQNKKKQIIGIVKDIHFLSMERKMPPLAFIMEHNSYPSCYPEIVVKLQSSDLEATVNKLRGAWQQAAPDWPFRLAFMDQKFENLYRGEQKVKQVVTLFTVLAIFLSLLGLFGLAAFSVDRRMREIGIRKAMGANTRHIASLLSGEFSRWIIISNLLAWPLAYWVMKNWLNNYVYKTHLALWIFIAAGMAALLVTGIILAYQTLRAGRADPASILREE